MKYSAPPTILDTEDDAQLAWDAIEPIWDDLPLSPAKRLREFLGELEPGQKALLAIDWCQKEIRNGGHRQLFGNGTGNLVPWAIDGFRLIGAEDYAVNLHEAAVLLGPDYPVTAAARKRAITSFQAAEVQKLENLTDAFLDLLEDEATDLERYRGQFVRSNPEQFIQARANP